MLPYYLRETEKDLVRFKTCDHCGKTELSGKKCKRVMTKNNAYMPWKEKTSQTEFRVLCEELDGRRCHLVEREDR